MILAKKHIYWITFFVAAITLAAYTSNSRFENSILQMIQIIFGSIFILFLPGYFLTQCFFGKDEIDNIERFALSFALSISVVPLLSFYLNLVGMPIHFFSIFMLVCCVIVGSIIVQLWFKKKNL